MMIEYPYIRGIHVHIDHVFRTSKLKIYYQDLVLYKPPVPVSTILVIIVPILVISET